MDLPTIRSEKPQAVTRAAAKRVGRQGAQRYLNRASGRMETAQQMHGYRRPAPSRPVGRPGAGSRPVGEQPRQQPSLIQMTPAQIEDRAKRIVNSEIEGERLPFRQRDTALTGEEAGVQQAHTQDYGQLQSGTAALASKQGESAKTFQNVAAEAVKRAEGATPGAPESAEHLGGQSPAPGSSLARQQEAARTLLTAIASAGQAGTNARQQSETNFLTNIQATEGQESAAGTRQIQSEYGKAKRENADKEAQVLATKSGRVGRLVLGTEAEQEKLRIAAGGLNIKGAEAERHATETRSNVQNRRIGQQLAGKKLGLAERAQGSREQHERADESYKRAGAAAKRTKDALDIKGKELSIKKALEGGSGHGLTTHEINESSGEAAKVFNIFKRARENGASPAVIRESITRGFFHRTRTKSEEEEKKKPYNEQTGLKLKQPIWLDVAEQIMQKGYVDAPTKQHLREMGLPDSEWSNHFFGGPRKPAPNAGKRKNAGPTKGR